jgi:hypothetical protein
LEYNHPFTLEAWIIPHRLCIEGICDHHYFISKVYTDSKSKVTGIACGQQDDGALYCYLRSDEFDNGANKDYGIYQETKNSVPNDIPLKFDFVYTGNGTLDGMLLYINGIQVQTKPHDIPTFTIAHSISNQRPIVLGNYGIRWINPWVNAYVDEVKIYDYDRTSEQILTDFQSDIVNKPDWNKQLQPSIIVTGQDSMEGTGLDWNSVTNATYMIEKNIDNTTWVPMTPDSYVYTSLNDYNVTGNHLYSYRVSAWNNGTRVAVSNVVTIEHVQFIPEFGHLAGMIIVASTLGVIVISRRFRL